MSGVRQAAAALSSLRREDQQWILSALPEAERRRLNQSLEELEASGLLRPETSNDPFMVPAESGAPAAPSEQIARASSEQMHAVLDGEPAALIARLLLAGQWPWAPRFVSMLGARARSALDQALKSAAPGNAPKLDAWLVDAVAARLANLAKAGAVRHRQHHLHDAVLQSRVWQLSQSLLRKAATWTR